MDDRFRSKRSVARRWLSAIYCDSIDDADGFRLADAKEKLWAFVGDVRARNRWLFRDLANTVAELESFAPLFRRAIMSIMI